MVKRMRSHSTPAGSLPITILTLSLFAIACEDTAQTAESELHAVIEDSAGVTIVENARPAPDSRLPWEFGAQPSLSIGSVDSGGADELFQVSDATRLGDGRIVIANSGSSEIRIFNPDGSHDRTWGSRGDGPGEFIARGPATVAPWPGDSIAAADALGRPRLSLFDMNGNHGRDVTLDAARGNILDLLPNGRIVSQGTQAFNRMAVFETRDLVRLETEWSVLDLDGTLYTSLGRFARGEAYFSEFWGGDMQHPFERRAEGAVWGNLVAIGVSDGYEIKAFAADGSLVRIVRRDWDPRVPPRPSTTSGRRGVCPRWTPTPPSTRSSRTRPGISGSASTGCRTRRPRCGPCSIRRDGLRAWSRLRKGWTYSRSAPITFWGRRKMSWGWNTCSCGRCRGGRAERRAHLLSAGLPSRLGPSQRGRPRPAEASRHRTP